MSGVPGFTVIPGSRRPDGTYRKEIRVKEGYVPPDEVPVFETKAHKFRGEIPKVPPGYSGKDEKQALTKAQAKNEKRKLKKKAQRAQPADATASQSEDEETVEQVCKNVEAVAIADGAAAASKPISEAQKLPQAAASGIASEAADDVAKRLKNLKKKLRIIDDLQAAVDKGQVKPNAEQLEKLKRRDETVKEIEALEK